MRRRSLTSAVLLVVVALLASGCFLTKDKPGPAGSAQGFLDGWAGNNATAAAGHTDDAAAAQAAIGKFGTALGTGAALTATLGAVTTRADNAATAAYRRTGRCPGSPRTGVRRVAAAGEGRRHLDRALAAGRPAPEAGGRPA